MSLERIQKSLRRRFKRANTYNQRLEHVLLHGPDTLLEEMRAFILDEWTAGSKIIHADATTRPGYLAVVLTHLRACQMLYVDQVHRLQPTMAELLYAAMTTSKFTVKVGRTEPQPIEVDVPQFTVVAATTSDVWPPREFPLAFDVEYWLDPDP